jgi:hypothetical protein
MRFDIYNKYFFKNQKGSFKECSLRSWQASVVSPYRQRKILPRTEANRYDRRDTA